MTTAALAKARHEVQQARGRALAMVRRVKSERSSLMQRGKAGVAGGIIGELEGRHMVERLSIGPVPGTVTIAVIGHLAAAAGTGEIGKAGDVVADSAIAIACYEGMKNRQR